MRIPLAVNLESRDGTVSKDAKVLNGILEPQGEDVPPKLRKRPGVTDMGNVHSGNAQLLYAWNGINTIQGDYLNRGTVSTITSAPSSQNLSPANAGLMFSAQETGLDAATQLLMFKNRTQGWTMDKAGAISAIVYPAGLGQSSYAVTSITRSTTVATVTLPSDAGIDVGDVVTVSGADQSDYNGSQTVTSVTTGTFIPARPIPITITRSSTTATATSVSPHLLTTATAYTVSGANQSEYNGAVTITVTSPTTFTYTVTVTPGVAVTWNPSDKSADITLSGGDLTAAGVVSGGGRAAVRATSGISSGKRYWEVTVGSIGNSLPSCGVANATMPLNDYIGRDANSWGYISGGIYHLGASTGAATYTSSDVLGFALDMDSGTIAFYKNNALQGTQTGLSGTIYPAYSTSSPVSSPSATAVTANYGATALTYTPPTGFSPYQSDSPVSPASGTIIVTDPEVTTDYQFTYTVGGSPVTPATGTITASTDGGTVPGIPYINGYFCVMDQNGVIYNSDSDDPTTWNALNFITAQNENGGGKALAKSQAYLIAFKEWSTEYFYDAQNAVASPFSPVDNGFTLIGCASSHSVTNLDGNLLWISQTKSQGRGVHRMVGLEQQKISTPDIERILNLDDLVTVYSMGVTVDGHSLYILTLVDSNITLCYDLTSQAWTEFSSLTVRALLSVASITRSGDVATVVFAVPHGLSDGDPLYIGGATQSQYNNYFQAMYVDATTVQIIVAGEPASPAGGTIESLVFLESYFKFTKYANFQGLNLFLHETDGHIYQMTPALFRDGFAPINLFTRSVRLDGGSLGNKPMGPLAVVGDSCNDIAMIRFSNDDSQTFSSYRPVDLSLDRPELRRNGSFRRRSIEFRHVGNTAPSLTALEI